MGRLETALGVPVSTLVPNPRPARFVRISRAGGSRQNIAQESALILVEAWADETVAAFDLAADAWAEISADFGDDAALSSPVFFPDPDTTQYRYQFTATLFISLEV